MGYDVIGLGAPVVDLVLQVSEDFLQGVGGIKGGQEPVDTVAIKKILETAVSEPLRAPGGSSTNTIKALANLGRKCAMIGMTGEDEEAVYFSSSLKQQNIVPLLSSSQSSPTAKVVCMVTPDGERTMRSNLGACVEMKPEYLKAEYFEYASLLHIEGYTLYNSPLPIRAMELAKEAGVKISLDLASFEIVHQFKDLITEILEKYVDIVFTNELEAEALTGKDEKTTCIYLSSLCEVAVVSIGKEGCYVAKEGEVKHFPAFPKEALDTTGAGDLFAGGFLHGYLDGESLELCARNGALLGAEAVQHLGAEVPASDWIKLRDQIAASVSPVVKKNIREKKEAVGS
ncbi:MAG: sugar/nucleoside kinase (ribokinase family) [Chlamydiales bacterium]|jgi:sugar/nucleoside kinase (ribokinase family)